MHSVRVIILNLALSQHTIRKRYSLLMWHSFSSRLASGPSHIHLVTFTKRSCQGRHAVMRQRTLSIQVNAKCFLRRSPGSSLLKISSSNDDTLVSVNVIPDLDALQDHIVPASISASLARLLLIHGTQGDLSLQSLILSHTSWS